MEPVVGLFYKVELSNGKSFEAARYNIVDNTDNPDYSNISFSLVGINYEDAKALIDGDINGITVKHCRPVAPPDYIAAPDVIQEDLHENFGTNPSIEPYYNIGYTIKFFKITEELLLHEKQFNELSETADTITTLFESL